MLTFIFLLFQGKNNCHLLLRNSHSLSKITFKTHFIHDIFFILRQITVYGRL